MSSTIIEYFPCQARSTRPVQPLHHTGFSRTLKPMEVHFHPDVQSKLDKLATETGRPAGELVEDAVLGYFAKSAEWSEIKDGIRTDLQTRGLRAPRLRLGALDGLEQHLIEVWPDFLSNPRILLNVGEQAVSKKLALRKDSGKLNGAEKSVLRQIFTRLGSGGG